MNFYPYRFINLYNAARNPSTVHCKNTALVNYYSRYLLQKLISVYQWEGIPDHWAENYFQYVLFCYGHVGIINTDKYGVIPQECGLGGFNVFYQPRYITVANPLLQGLKQPVIGEECEVIKMMPDYGSPMDIISTYADLLALCLETAGTNLLNSKLAYVFTAGSKSMAESFKKLYDNIASGEPAAFLDKELYNEDGTRNWDAFSQNLGQNYITDKILADMKNIEDQFNTMIGIPNANTQKKERLITDEVNANNVDTFSRAALWLETMQRDCLKVNEMFGTDIWVTYRYEQQYEEGGDTDGNIELMGRIPME